MSTSRKTRGRSSSKGATERPDYQRIEWIKRQVVIALFSDDELMQRFVVKGGSALDLAYLYAAGRSSIDVDVSIADDFAPDQVEAIGDRVIAKVTAQFLEQGYQVFDASFTPRPSHRGEDLPDFWGGYMLVFKVIARDRYREHSDDPDTLRRLADVVGPRNRRKFKVDISKHEYCELKRPHELDDYRIYVYTPELLIAEKLRAICQQMPAYPYGRGVRKGRARDFYDIHLVSTNEPSIEWGSEEFAAVVRRVFEAKKVPLELLAAIDTADVREFHRDDFVSVQDSVEPDVSLESFDHYFDFVVQRTRELQHALGDE